MLPNATGPPASARPRHALLTWQHKVYQRKNGPQSQIRRAGGVERSPPGDGFLDPRERSGSAGGEGFLTLSEAFPSRDFLFVPPVWDFNCMEGDCFPRMEHYHPPGIFFRVPGNLGSAVERPTLCSQVSGSSLAYCRVFCFLFCMIFSMTSLFFPFSSGRQFPPPPFLEHYLSPRGFVSVSPFFFFCTAVGMSPVLFCTRARIFRGITVQQCVLYSYILISCEQQCSINSCTIRRCTGVPGRREYMG